MDLFEMMGIPMPETEEKKEVTKEKKAEKKKGTKAAAKSTTIHREVKVNTGFGVWTPEIGPEGKPYGELAEMFQKEYPGACGLYECGTASTLRVMLRGDFTKFPAALDTKLPAGTEVCFGCFQMATTEEGTVAEALEAFGNQFEAFEGCRTAYLDEEDHMLCPYILEAEKEPEITFPATVGFGDDTVCITDVPDQPDFRKALMQAYEKQFHVKLDGLHYKDGMDRWLPVYKKGRQVTASGSSTKTVKKEEQRYPLPVQVRIPLQTLTFDRDRFPEGTEDVTGEDVRKVLEAMYFEYSKERTTMEYDESHGCFIAVLKTSSKGRTEDMQLATFELDEDNRELVSFSYQLPKIPGSVLYTVWKLGRMFLPNEVAVQLFYDRESGSYYMYLPKQTITPYSVRFNRSAELECKDILVADIHTHGQAGAFFSGKDDKDELGWRLFLVAGKLQGSQPEIKMRAGANGCFLSLDPSDYFDLGNTDFVPLLQAE